VTEDFTTKTMNVIDAILSRIGKDDDGLGPNWSSTERIVHKFHMYDVWSRVLMTYNETVEKDPPQVWLLSVKIEINTAHRQSKGVSTNIRNAN
jgi:hypothetical protein